MASFWYGTGQPICNNPPLRPGDYGYEEKVEIPGYTYPELFFICLLIAVVVVGAWTLP